MSAALNMEVSHENELSRLEAAFTDGNIGGCCPDGYLCQTAGDCVPPSGSPYTYGCPASHYLCPSSANYGCCPDGMGCAVNQCYSTESSTITTTMTVKTTEDGSVRTVTRTTVTVKTPDVPTAFPTLDSEDGSDDQALLKYFPTAVAKVSPTNSPDDKDDGGGGGLSTGQLGGIIAGAVAFLIIVLVGAYIIIRHLNKVVAAVSSTKQSSSSDNKPRPPMREFKPTDSEIDALSVDPLMASPRPSYPRQASSPDYHFGAGSPDLSLSDQTPTSFGGAYQMVSPGNNSRNTSIDETANNGLGYFDTLRGRPPRLSQQSGASTALPAAAKRASNDSHGTYQHVRHWSNASEGSTDTEAGGQHAQAALMELEGSPYVPELMGSPTVSAVGSPRPEERQRSNSGSRPPVAHQRKRSESRVGREQGAGSTQLGVVDEEIHGFHGPSDQLMGQTAHRPATQGSGGQGRLGIGADENSTAQ